MSDDETQRREATEPDDHRGDMDAFNADPMSTTGIIDGLGTVRSTARLGNGLVDLGGWIARRLREFRERRRASGA
jgi:hypothetical protein